MDSYSPAWAANAGTDNEENLAVLPPLERFPSQRNKSRSPAIDYPEEQSQMENNSALSRLKRLFWFGPTSPSKSSAPIQEDGVLSRAHGNLDTLAPQIDSTPASSSSDCHLEYYMPLPAISGRRDQGGIQASVPYLRRRSSDISVHSLSGSVTPSHFEEESFHGANATLHEDEIETSHHEYAAGPSDDECNTSRPQFTSPFGDGESIRGISKPIPEVVPILPALPNLPSEYCKKRKASSLRNMVLSSEIVPRRRPEVVPVGGRIRPISTVINADEIRGSLSTTSVELRHPRRAISVIDLPDLGRCRGSDVLQEEAIRRRWRIDHPQADDQNTAEAKKTNHSNTGLAVDIVPGIESDPSPWASIKKEASLDLRVYTLRRSSQQSRRALSFGYSSSGMLPEPPIELCQRRINYRYGSQDAESQQQSELPSFSAAVLEAPMEYFRDRAVDNPFPDSETIREMESGSDDYIGPGADERELELNEPFRDEETLGNVSKSEHKADELGNERANRDEERSKGKGKVTNLSVNF